MKRYYSNMFSIFLGLATLFTNNNYFGQTNAEHKIKSSKSLDKFLTVKNDYIKIPIIKTASGHLHLSVELNGVKGDFLLDTGAGTSLIDSNKAIKFNLKSLDSEAFAAVVAGQQSLQKGTIGTFRIENFSKNNFEVFLMNLDHVNNSLIAMGFESVDGLIGSDILVESNAIIDYKNLILYLKKNK